MDLIVASHRMSRMIDPRRPRGPSLQQLQDLRRDASIRELREQQQILYDQIRKKFNFIYRAEGQPIYVEYQQVKRDIDHLLKEKGRALKAQLQADYDAAAPMQDMLAQTTVNDAVLSPVQHPPAPVKYAFEERARIARAFFDPPSSTKYDGNLDWQVSIIDDFVSLCNRQERRPRKPRRTWGDDTATISSDDTSDIDVKSECSDLTRHFDVNSHSNASLSSVCTALATPCYPCMNDNTSSAVSIRCSATSTGTINFSLARAAHSPMSLVGSSRSKASCTLKVTQRGSMESNVREMLVFSLAVPADRFAWAIKSCRHRSACGHSPVTAI